MLGLKVIDGNFFSFLFPVFSIQVLGKIKSCPFFFSGICSEKKVVFWKYLIFFSRFSFKFLKLKKNV